MFASTLRSAEVRDRPVAAVRGGEVVVVAWVGAEAVVVTTADPLARPAARASGADSAAGDDARAAGRVVVWGTQSDHTTVLARALDAASITGTARGRRGPPDDTRHPPPGHRDD